MTQKQYRDLPPRTPNLEEILGASGNDDPQELINFRDHKFIIAIIIIKLRDQYLFNLKNIERQCRKLYR